MSRILACGNVGFGVHHDYLINYGMLDVNLSLANPSPPISSTTNEYKRELGYKNYELTKHLGNVLATVSDQKEAKAKDIDSDGVADRLDAIIKSANDYYPFGMIMPGRSLLSESYRFGFNGKEKDDEWKGTGNSYDFGDRIYDPRIARWLSVDPKFKQYADLSPYVFAGNNPIYYVDPDGAAYTPAEVKNFYLTVGKPLVEALTAKGISQKNAMFVVGQVLLEQGYAPQSSQRKKMWAANAFFNVKGKGDNGSVTVTTAEYIKGKKVTIDDNFRSYKNMSGAINDYLDVLKRCFQDACNVLFNDKKSIEDFAEGLMNGKFGAYATDPNYKSKMDIYLKTVEKGFNKHLPDFGKETSLVDDFMNWWNLWSVSDLYGSSAINYTVNTKGNLNMRSGAGTGFKIIGSLSSGTSIT